MVNWIVSRPRFVVYYIAVLYATMLLSYNSGSNRDIVHLLWFEYKKYLHPFCAGSVCSELPINRFSYQYTCRSKFTLFLPRCISDNNPYFSLLLTLFSIFFQYSYYLVIYIPIYRRMHFLSCSDIPWSTPLALYHPHACTSVFIRHTNHCRISQIVGTLQVPNARSSDDRLQHSLLLPHRLSVNCRKSHINLFSICNLTIVRV